MPSLKKYLSSSLLAVAAAVGGALLEASTDLIKTNFEPALLATRNLLEDWFLPLPHDALLGISLDVYAPSTVGNNAWVQSVSATIPAKRCHQAGWTGIVQAFDRAQSSNVANAILTIRCRPSGRVTVALSPQSGRTVEVYDGRFNDGDKLGFPGVPGSYYAGVLTMHRLDAVQPEGPWVPVNKCQLTDSCDPNDFVAE